MVARDLREQIYVQIPAYRDRELLATVTDLVATASCPHRLVIAIAWQYGPEEAHLEADLRAAGPVRLYPIPASESRGCNWARQLLQRGWDGEQYTLFIDSHHRFVPGWDECLLRLHRRQQEAGFDRPILTGYLPPYNPEHDPQGRVRVIYRMAVAESYRGLVFRLTGHPIPDWERLTAPVPASFASLHLLFTTGDFNQVVLFDPDIYFFADEVAIALRGFTNGWDLFHPHEVLGWHLYDRTTRRTHWADHSGWALQNDRSVTRLQSLFRGELRGPYGLGSERTVANYESSTGVRLLTDERHPSREKEDLWRSHRSFAMRSTGSMAAR